MEKNDDGKKFDDDFGDDIQFSNKHFYWKLN